MPKIRTIGTMVINVCLCNLDKLGKFVVEGSKRAKMSDLGLVRCAGLIVGAGRTSLMLSIMVRRIKSDEKAEEITHCVAHKSHILYNSR